MSPSISGFTNTTTTTTAAKNDVTSQQQQQQQALIMAEEETPSTNKSPLLTPVIWCILITETGERFAYYGFRAILVLYFTLELDYDENTAIALFAYTTALAYLSPLLGALLADGDWGRYRTIWVFGLVYIVGLMLLTAAAGFSDLFQWSVATERFWTIVGLLLVCLGTGGIKPCVSAFGADQVVGAMMMEEEEQAEAEKRQTHNNLEDRNNKETTTTVDDDSSAFVPMNDDCNEIFQDEPAIDPRETAPMDTTTTTSSSSHREQQVMAFFNYFYFCINVGAVTSIAIIPMMRSQFGFGIAFLLPTLFMVTAMLLFLSMRRQYVHHVPGQDGSSLSNTFLLCGWLLRRDIWKNVLHPWMQRSAPWFHPGAMPVLKHDSNNEEEASTSLGSTTSSSSASQPPLDKNRLLEEQLRDAAQALHVLPILAMLPIFWCLYDQQSSVWTLQATRMELNGFGLQLQPEQLNIVNPLQILVFVPLFDRCIYPKMLYYRFNIRPLRRMAYGMFLAAAAFFISGYVEMCIQYREEQVNNNGNDDDDDYLQSSSNKIHVFWQLPQITLLSIAEIFVSVTGLEFAYSSSPERLKAFLMALFLLTTSVGDFLSGILYSTVFTHLNRAWILHICGILMMINLFAFVRLSYWWEERDRIRKIKNNNNSSTSFSARNDDGIEFQNICRTDYWVPDIDSCGHCTDFGIK